MVQVMVNQEKIHKKSYSNSPKERGGEVEQLKRTTEKKF